MSHVGGGSTIAVGMCRTATRLISPAVGRRDAVISHIEENSLFYVFEVTNKRAYVRKRLDGVVLGCDECTVRCFPVKDVLLLLANGKRTNYAAGLPSPA